MDAIPDAAASPSVTGRLVTARPGAALDGLVAACRALDQPVRVLCPGQADLETDIGRIRFTATGAELRIGIAAATEANAFMLREAVAARIEALDAALLDGLRWSGTLPAAGLPPNFRAGRLVRVDPLGAAFWRMEVEAEGLSPFARDGLHLRVVLPPRDRPPIWPRTDCAGRLRWPDGPGAPHVAVYTIRRVDPDAGRMTIDAFRHGRGRACDWLERARRGDQIGLLGPGGGWIPRAPHLVLAGDETALPAIARILEAVPSGTRGAALIETATRSERLPVSAPPGIALRHLARDTGETLEREIRNLDLGAGGHRHVWFAAETARAAAMRRHFRQECGLARGECTVAGYWSER